MDAHPFARIVINGLYDATMVVINEYNRRRRGKPLEILDTPHFFIDAYRVIDEKGRARETAPLYNKGYVGMSEKGDLVFGRRRMLGGSFKMPGIDFSIAWKKEDVIDSPGKLNDFEKSRSDVAVITPMVSKQTSFSDPGYVHDSAYFNDYNVPVGRDRINIIVIDDHVQAIVKGEILMPSLGYVISLRPEAYEDFLKQHELLNRKEGLPAAEFDYDWPEDAQRPVWFAGGGALLVSNGENLVKDRATEEENFKREGWFHRLSIQTQGTPVEDWVRGPRSILGQTKTGKMFAFTFSGRTKRYAGANFAEAIEIIRLELAKQREEIQDAINMDGGSSVGFSIRALDGKVHIVSYPAKGSTSGGRQAAFRRQLFLFHAARPWFFRNKKERPEPF